MLDLTKPYVLNVGLVPKQVGIIRVADGAKGSMRVMGRGRVNIPEGFVKDSNWLALNGGKAIKCVEPVVVTNVVAKTGPSPSGSTVAPQVTNKSGGA